MRKILVLAACAAFMVGCASFRVLRVQMPAMGTQAIVMAEIEEEATTPWSVGDLSMTVLSARSVDGSTTASATITATKDSAVGIWTTVFSYAAGIITALAL